MTKRPADRLYSEPLQEIVDFQFDETVTHVFADMINRSVPGYANLIHLLGISSAHFAAPGSNLYDLGCSLGACSLSMQHHCQQQNCQIIAVDNSQAMLRQLEMRLDKNLRPAITPLCQSVQETIIQNASVVVFNYTLQFIPLAERQAILEQVYQGMRPGGALFLSEKIVHQNPAIQPLIETLHHGFKQSQGYSLLEIAQKRAALENILIPESREQHEQRLANIGFRQIHSWFQCFNFVSWLAIK